MKKLLETLYITTPESYLFEREHLYLHRRCRKGFRPDHTSGFHRPVWEKYALHRIAILLLSE